MKKALLNALFAIAVGGYSIGKTINHERTNRENESLRHQEKDNRVLIFEDDSAVVFKMTECDNVLLCNEVSEKIVDFEQDDDYFTLCGEDCEVCCINVRKVTHFKLYNSADEAIYNAERH